MANLPSNKEVISRVPAALRAVRKEKDWTQEELAHRAGLTTTYVSQIERGLKSPSLRSLGKIADALGITLSTFFRRIEK